MDGRKVTPLEVAVCLRRCVAGVSSRICEECPARGREPDRNCVDELHRMGATAIEELCWELRKHENAAKGKTCGTCQHFDRDPGRSSGRCRKRRYLKNRYGQSDSREFIPTQSRTACKSDYEPMEQEEMNRDKEN